GLAPLAEPHAFHVYRGERGWAIVAGHGKVSAAAATVYLHLLAGGEVGQAWLNVGIGGHSQRPVGDAVIAPNIQDPASGRARPPPPHGAGPDPRADGRGGVHPPLGARRRGRRLLPDRLPVRDLRARPELQGDLRQPRGDPRALAFFELRRAARPGEPRPDREL